MKGKERKGEANYTGVVKNRVEAKVCSSIRLNNNNDDNNNIKQHKTNFRGSQLGWNQITGLNRGLQDAGTLLMLDWTVWRQQR